MKLQLPPEIAEILNYILEETVKNNRVFADELKPIGIIVRSGIRQAKSSNYKPGGG